MHMPPMGMPPFGMMPGMPHGMPGGLGGGMMPGMPPMPMGAGLGGGMPPAFGGGMCGGDDRRGRKGGGGKGGGKSGGGKGRGGGGGGGRGGGAPGGGMSGGGRGGGGGRGAGALAPGAAPAPGGGEPREGGKGKGRKGGGKGKWVFLPERKPLTDEEIQERRQAAAERHAARVAEEQRQVLTATHIDGEVVQRAKRHAWLKPKDPNAIPAECREKLAAMNAEFRAKVTDDRAFCGGIDTDVLYLAVADIAEEKLILAAGMAVKFKVYVDNKGVGACDVISGEAPQVVSA